ncbi:SH2 domain-containing protein 4A-like [Contarinia nasturtii]|uniref:SH2 domain-containing protein 4A-like n=1 Tax=Contarinia nasturtii TaxID=265458 RepID=UPI0012D44585|nr:SH2 domain-containing protein 4A-like [Contarinia nasturtii]XP_031640192.1 SH2 domain-containing protein 4A-like [Contarinia nasturtii]
MLRQILNDMYVDPEILSGLDEYQKQTLFCKMREEQIRRWRIREQENDSRTSAKKSTPNKKNKNVSFREDDEGEPFVVVIEPAIYTDSDSDDSDLNMKKPGHEEAKQRARELAEIETKELRRQYKEIIITDLDTNGKTNCCKNEKNAFGVDDCPLASMPIIDDMEIYCSVDELRERTKLVNGIAPSTKLKLTNNVVQKNNIINFSFSDNKNEKNVILKEISNNKPTQKVSAKIALWEQRVIGEKTNEIYQRLRKKQKEQAQEEAKKQEEAWKEQERKAKEADIQYREIARRAREEHRKSLNNDDTANIISTTNSINSKNGHVNGNATNVIKKSGLNGTIKMENGIKNGVANGCHSPMTNGTSTKGPAPQPPSINSTPQTQPQSQSQPSSSPPSSLDALIPRPASHEKMIQWYHDVEITKGAGLESVENRLPCKWFYGLMSRIEAEQLLESEPMGTFLVRLSEKIWGYAISYKDIDRCKHYLINASTGQYKFLGANQLTHATLNNLIKHHATVPITAMGHELLIRPCPRSVAVNSKIFEGLF